jgi:hypothetical protein
VRAIIAGAVLVLAGCSNKPPEATGCDTVLLRDYSEAFQSALVAEIKTAPANAVWPEAISDYRITRDALAACQTPPKK